MHFSGLWRPKKHQTCTMSIGTIADFQTVNKYNFPFQHSKAPTWDEGKRLRKSKIESFKKHNFLDIHLFTPFFLPTRFLQKKIYTNFFSKKMQTKHHKDFITLLMLQSSPSWWSEVGWISKDTQRADASSPRKKSLLPAIMLILDSLAICYYVNCIMHAHLHKKVAQSFFFATLVYTTDYL